MQQGLEQFIKHGALAVVQVYLAINGVEDSDALALLAKRGDQNRKRLKFRRVDGGQIRSLMSHFQGICLPIVTLGFVGAVLTKE